MKSKDHIIYEKKAEIETKKKYTGIWGEKSEEFSVCSYVL